MKKCLTIAGSDSGGGAGIQADLKTFCAFHVFGMSAITAVTVQDSTQVKHVHAVPVEVIVEQIRATWEDFSPDAIKIGMLGSVEVISAVARVLCELNPERRVPVVLDPVMITKSGTALLASDGQHALDELRELASVCTLITPNVPEAEALLGGRTLTSAADIREAGLELQRTLGCAVLMKGGHDTSDSSRCVDMLVLPGAAAAEDLVCFDGVRIQSDNNHGTGCTLSSAIAANLAKGMELAPACQLAKDYVVGAIKHGQKLGHGVGQLHHMNQFWQS